MHPSQAPRTSLYTSILNARHPGRDCRDPEAMDGDTKTDSKYHRGLISKIKRSHPCTLDSDTNLSGTDLHLPEERQAG
ncbi:hypothetical protein [Methylobacter sp.]|uniref:hypothetical protein n=1 Tax=Methylobacter sp. TaxID=2051955 RepID=UPI00121D0C68|nr:hypothetical protein [Methylobacter sp.]TAK59898.1 MAG: hypothetical protein EPO18_19075 [Methylobacter sp.]